MARKIFLILVMFLFVISFLNAGQNRLTTHGIYYNPVGDGRGSVFYSKHVSGEYWDLIQVDEFGMNLRQLSNDNLVEMHSRDSFKIQGKPVIIKMGKDTDIISIGTTGNVDINSLTNVFSTELSVSQAVISPDGMKIAFVATNRLLGEKTGTLYIIDINGTDPRSLSTSLPVRLGENVKLDSAFEIPGSTFTKKNVSSGSSIQFSPDSKQISYVNSYGELVIINVTGGVGGPLVITGYEFNNHYWLKSGRIMFVSSNNLGTISPDGMNYAPVYSLNGSILDYAVSPDESKIAVVTTSLGAGNTLSIVILNSSGTVLNQMTIQSRQLNSKISWISDSKIVFGDMLNIFTLGITGAQVPQNITNNTDFIENLKTARGNKIVYTTFNGDLNTMNADGSGKVVLIPSTTGVYIVDMALSPSGQKILISINDNSGLGKRGLYIKNSDGTGTDIIEENITYSYYFPEFNWSPAEDSIIYRSALDSAYYIIGPDGKNKKPVLMQGDTGSDFVFSPDGKKLVFNGYLMSQQQSGVFITDLTSYQLIPTTYSVSCYPLDWKANTILLEETEIPGKLYAIKPDGTLKKQIDIGPYSKIKLSPDGKKLAFTREALQEVSSQRDHGLFIVVIEDNVSPETGGGTADPLLTEIKLTPNEYANFDWSEDSKLIAYEHSIRNTGINRIFIANSDGASPYLLTPAISVFTSNPFFINNNRIVYYGDFDIWLGDFNPGVPPENILPFQLGDIKIVVPEESGKRWTVNPKLGKPVPIGFKPSDETITEGEYTLRIFNNVGKKVYEEKRNFISTDNKYFDWIPQNLPTGLYVIHISGPGVNIYKKIPVLR